MYVCMYVCLLSSPSNIEINVVFIKCIFLVCGFDNPLLFCPDATTASEKAAESRHPHENAIARRRMHSLKAAAAVPASRKTRREYRIARPNRPPPVDFGRREQKTGETTQTNVTVGKDVG